ncbi:MAG: creatininase family protein [Myxococcota bacterium]
MGAPDSAARGRALLAERMTEAPAAVARVPEILAPLLERPRRLPRCLVTTGIGTSEGHARHLAELAARLLGQPARFASTGSLAAGAPPGAAADWLVVFSQGLSRNARHAFLDVEAWAGVVLVTGLDRDAGPAEGVTPEQRAWLEALERRGVVRIDMGCGPEYGALIRVIGARVGHAIAWSLLRTLAHRRLASTDPLAIAAASLQAAQEGALDEADRTFPPGERIADFFAPERALLLVSEAGALELCGHLALKLAEGMLRPAPERVDVLHFAHGPLQSHFDRPLSILYLAPRPLAPVPSAAGPLAARARATDRPAVDAKTDAERWRARLEATLDPERHALRCVRTRLPLPFAVLELEAIFDAWILRHQDETGTDLVAWPGASRERALYDAGPGLARPASLRGGEQTRAERAPEAAEEDASMEALASSVERSPAPVALERATWPELAEALASGRRTAIVALGSIEQHGPHLPLATDRWIADALATALARRVGDAIALPALPFGCASEHLDFAGTLHVEPATLEALLGDLLGSLRRHGFARAFLFTAHGGNVAFLRAMQPRLEACARPLALALGEVDANALQAAIVAAAGLDPRSAGPHAGEYETSAVAWLEPGAVRAARLAPGTLIDPAAVSPALFHPSLRPNAPEGVVGDPRRASRDRGAAYLAAWVDALEAAYRSAFGVVAGTGRAAEKNRK